MRRTQNPHGFSLVELLIVVAILGIITAVALPSYQGSVRKSRRADAYVAIMKIQQEQEKFRANCTEYARTINGSSACDSATPNNNNLGLSSATSPDSYYTLALSGVSGTAYTITATADSTKSQNSDTGCTSIVLTTSSGTTTQTPSDCWRK